MHARSLWYDSGEPGVRSMWVDREIAGKYKVERVLGEGGMGVVLFARHAELGHPVAIKCLKREFAEHAEARGRFEREARAAAALVSDHVAHVTDVGRMPDGTPFMVMEYLEGEDLAERVEREGPVPFAFAIDCMLQACEGLAEAHEKGIVHRDVKPSNLFLARKPGGKTSLKVLDFGIAKASSHGGTELTRTSAIVGSPLYMSPEQLRESKDVDARTDVWSLGVTLFYLLTKRFPFEAEAVGEVYGKILYTEPQSVRAFAAAVPEELEAVVRDCLQKDPSKRIASVASLAERLATLACAPVSVASSARAPDVASGPHTKAAEPVARASAGVETLAMGAPPATTSPRERSGGTTLGMEAPMAAAPAEATTIDPSPVAPAPKRRVGAVLGGLAAAGILVGALALRGAAPGDSQGSRTPAPSADVTPVPRAEVASAVAVDEPKGGVAAAVGTALNAAPAEVGSLRAPKRSPRGTTAAAADAGAPNGPALVAPVSVLAAPPPVVVPPTPPSPPEKRKRASALEMQLE